MNKASVKVFFQFVLLSVVILFLVSAQTDSIYINEVTRSIELSSHLSVHNIFFRVSSGVPVSEFVFTLTSFQRERLSLFQAFDEKSQLLDIVSDATAKKTVQGLTYYEYKIILNKPLSPNSSLLKVLLAFTKTMVASPKSVKQTQSQLVLYEDSHYFFSPYIVQNQNSQFKVPSRFESYSELKPSTQSGNTLRFGPYENIPPFSHSPLVIHFENNLPFVNIKTLLKEYEVSHWGNLAVEETYHVEHIGAKLEGAFSRFDFMRTPSPSAINHLNFHIPKESQDWYYRDEIGNVSSSHVSVGTSDTRLQIIPRFVLFGGWHIDFYLGYNLPLQNYLSTYLKDSSRYLLNVTFGVSLEEPYSIDDHTVRIILPEGASDIHVKLPFTVDTENLDDKHFTYLDTTGRPVVVLHKRNTILFHNQPIEISYSFRQILMLKEPFLLTGAFLFLLLAVVVYVRIDLSIVPRVHQKL